uniref:Uncharacterized protein n=1 Tax=Quercus lobata TaxID=97700 RepID=A0A7N2LG43_QUELO
MATKPGILTDWPWKPLGSFKIWISISRYQTAKGKNRIVDKSIEFKQVDRERNWYTMPTKQLQYSLCTSSSTDTAPPHQHHTHPSSAPYACSCITAAQQH